MIIKRANFAACLKVLNSAMVSQGSEAVTSLACAFEYWCHRTVVNDLTDELMITDYATETSCAESTLYQLIAPFVQSGGVVTVRGEEGEQLRYTFADGAVTATSGEVSFVDERSKARTRESLAAYAHSAWTGWMVYMFSKCHTADAAPTCGKELVIPAECVKRWKRQMDTNYVDLPADEQKSDLAEADKILAIIAKHQ
jgi:hypothetical protein